MGETKTSVSSDKCQAINFTTVVQNCLLGQSKKNISDLSWLNSSPITAGFICNRKRAFINDDVVLQTDSDSASSSTSRAEKHEV